MKKILLLASFVSMHSSALTLTQAYDLSSSHDPQIQSAQFALNATETEKDIGMAGLLPTISASGKAIRSTGVTDLDQNTITGSSNYTSSTDYTSHTKTLNVRQQLVDFDKYALYQQGLAKTDVGRYQFKAAQQDLFARVAQNYFQVVRMQNELALVESQASKIQTLLEQTKVLYTKGEGTITDIDETQAKLEIVTAQIIDIQSQLLNAQHQLENQTGLEQIDAIYVNDVIPKNNLFADSQNQSYWLDMGLKNSPVIEANNSSIQVAQQALNQQKAGYLPKLYLAGQLSQTDATYKTGNQDRTDKTIALIVDIPLYSGGSVGAYSEKALNVLNKSKSDMDIARYKVKIDTEKYYFSVVNGWKKCKALQTAVSASERSLSSVEVGYKAGTRTISDILNAQQGVYSSKRDLLNSKLNMLLGFIMMKATVGSMDRKSLSEVESYLTEGF